MDATIIRRRPERTTRTREAIVGAAARILAEKGYEATSLEEVAVVAGIVRATVYYHFSSKEALYEAVIVSASADGVRQVRQAVDEGGSCTEIFVRVLDGMIETIVDPASRYIYQWERVRTDLEIRRRVRAGQREYVEAIADVIRAGQSMGAFLPGDPKVLAYLVIAAAGGLARWYRPDGDVPPEAVRAILGRLVMADLG